MSLTDLILAFFIDFPFSLRRLTRTDDAENVARLGVRHDKQSPSVGNPERDETTLASGMIGVPRRGRQRVSKRSCSFLEGDPVLLKISSCLPWIPLELHGMVLPQLDGPALQLRRNA